MIHPLLTPRLFSRPQNEPPLPPTQSEDMSALARQMGSAAKRAYLRWGPGTGFILGLAIAFWLWVPNPSG